MTEEKEFASLEEQVRQATEEGHDLEKTVSRLVLRQLGQRRPDPEALKQLAQAVLDGAHAGVGRHLHASAEEARIARARLSEAVSGLDGALAQFVEATKLALEEAAGNARAFSTEDLDLATDELGRIEEMLVETLRRAASDTKDLAGEIYGDLAEHFARQGSRVKSSLKETLRALSGTARGQARTGKKLAEASCELLREITAGALIGVAERIRPSGRKP